jgi:hypothetical protein
VPFAAAVSPSLHIQDFWRIDSYCISGCAGSFERTSLPDMPIPWHVSLPDMRIIDELRRSIDGVPETDVLVVGVTSESM